MHERFHPQFIHVCIYELIPVKELIASRECCAPPVGEVLKNELTVSCAIHFAKFNKKMPANTTRKAGIVRAGSDFPPLIIRFEYGNQFSSI